jgi:hypothetical protein
VLRLNEILVRLCSDLLRIAMIVGAERLDMESSSFSRAGKVVVLCRMKGGTCGV